MASASAASARGRREGSEPRAAEVAAVLRMSKIIACAGRALAAAELEVDTRATIPISAIPQRHAPRGLLRQPGAKPGARAWCGIGGRRRLRCGGTGRIGPRAEAPRRLRRAARGAERPAALGARGARRSSRFGTRRPRLLRAPRRLARAAAPRARKPAMTRRGDRRGSHSSPRQERRRARRGGRRLPRRALVGPRLAAIGAREHLCRRPDARGRRRENDADAVASVRGHVRPAFAFPTAIERARPASPHACLFTFASSRGASSGVARRTAAELAVLLAARVGRRPSAPRRRPRRARARRTAPSGGGGARRIEATRRSRAWRARPRDPHHRLRSESSSSAANVVLVASIAIRLLRADVGAAIERRDGSRGVLRGDPRAALAAAGDADLGRRRWRRHDLVGLAATRAPLARGAAAAPGAAAVSAATSARATSATPRHRRRQREGVTAGSATSQRGRSTASAALNGCGGGAAASIPIT